jgi:hypothetical protein
MDGEEIMIFSSQRHLSPFESILSPRQYEKGLAGMMTQKAIFS